MRSSIKHLFLTLATAVVLSLAATRPCAGQIPPVPLPTLDGFSRALPLTVNAAGQIAGDCFSDTPGGSAACIWQGGTVQFLHQAGDDMPVDWLQTHVTRIGATGAIVGYGLDANLYEYGFVWQNGTWTALGVNGTEATTRAVDINDAGATIQVAGYSYSYPRTSEHHGFIWENGVITPLVYTRTFVDPNTGLQVTADLPMAPGFTNSINSSGQVVAIEQSLRMGYCPAAIYQKDGNGGVTITPVSPDGLDVFDAAINSAGHVAMYSGSGRNPGVYTPDSGYRELRLSDQFETGTYFMCDFAGIDDQGRVILCASSTAYTDHLFCWTDDGSANGSFLEVPLSSLLAPGETVYNLSVCMNSQGQVAGRFYTADYSKRIAFFWDPAAPAVIKRLGIFIGDLEAWPAAIRNDGLVVGWSSWGADHACTWNTAGPENTAPTLTQPDNQTTPEGQAFSLQLVGDDADMPRQKLLYSITGGPDGLSVDPDTGLITWTPTEAQGPGDYSIAAQVTDGMATASVTFSIHVDEVNAPPTAEAGASQTVDVPHDGDPATNTASVTLDGSASSDPENGTLTYSWTEGGRAIATGANPTVNLPAGEHTITLTVTDPGGATGTDDVVITVDPEPNQAPTANAGPDQMVGTSAASATVALDGSGSGDPDNDTLTYSWSEGGSEIAVGQQPKVPLALGKHTITLTVADAYGATSTDTVQVEVRQASVLTFSNATVSVKGKMLTVTIKTAISNPNSAPALDTSITTATLDGVGATTSLPLKVGTVRVGASKNISLSFARPSTKSVSLYIEGTCTLGTIWTFQTLTLP